MNKYFHAVYFFIVVVYDFVAVPVNGHVMHVVGEVCYENPDSGVDRIISPCWNVCQTSSGILSTMQFNVPGMTSYVVVMVQSWDAFNPIFITLCQDDCSSGGFNRGSLGQLVAGLCWRFTNLYLSYSEGTCEGCLFSFHCMKAPSCESKVGGGLSPQLASEACVLHSSRARLAHSARARLAHSASARLCRGRESAQARLRLHHSSE